MRNVFKMTHCKNVIVEFDPIPTVAMALICSYFKVAPFVALKG